jgi:nucleoside-diphosphate-sugar epimerase
MARNVSLALSALPMSSFTYLSSVDVYGRPPSESPISENSPIGPTGHYGLSKYASECLLRLGLRCPVTVLRCPGMYGPADQERSVVGQFVSKIRSGIEIELVAGGTSLRDYVHSDDVFHVVSALLSRQPAKHTILNLATGQSISLLRLVDLISHAVGRSALVRSVPPQAAPYDLVFDTRKLLEYLPTTRFTPIEEGIRDYCQRSRP